MRKRLLLTALALSVAWWLAVVAISGLAYYQSTRAGAIVIAPHAWTCTRLSDDGTRCEQYTRI